MWRLCGKLQIVLILGLFIESISASGNKEFGPITLIPNDTEYVRYTKGSHADKNHTQSLIVSCLGEDERYLKWMRPDGAEVEEKGRVHVEAFDKQLRLIIHPIRKEDQGTWTCCRESDENDGQSFDLKVYVPISFEPVESVITVKEDQDIAIPCDVDGYPEPATQWYHNGVSLQEKLLKEEFKYKKTADALIIKNINRHNAGEYTCKAFQISEVATHVEEQTVLLNVKYSPNFAGHFNRTQYGFIDGEVNLTCVADGVPWPKFLWYREGKRINSAISDENISVLHINIKSSDSFGEYKCKADNEMGTKHQFIHLREGKKPESPQEFFLRGFNSDTFHVDVGAKVDAKNPQTFDIKGYRFELIQKENFKDKSSWSKSWVKDFSIADGATYLLGPLSENTTYLVRVSSKNVAGFSDWTEVKEFTTLPKLPFVPSKSSRMLSSILSVNSLAMFSVISRQYCTG